MTNIVAVCYTKTYLKNLKSGTESNQCLQIFLKGLRVLYMMLPLVPGFAGLSSSFRRHALMCNFSVCRCHDSVSFSFLSTCLDVNGYV